MRWFLLCGTFVAVACLTVASVLAVRADAGRPKSGKLRHVVLFKFKEGTTPEQIKAIEDAFRALPAKVPEVVDFEWGVNNSPEHKDQGFTHCFLLTFNDEAGRVVYLPHPAHKEFGNVLRPHLDKVLVIDYAAQQ